MSRRNIGVMLGVLGVMGVVGGMCSLAAASVSDYEDLTEGFFGETFTHNGVTYRDVNNVAGVFPTGETFEATGINGLGSTIIVEDSTLFYNDFPTWGSAVNTLTFGTAFVNGPNLSLGALSTVTMDLDQNATSATVDTAFYENGPWGGIEFHLDAYRNGNLVGSDSFTLSDHGGRDNIAFNTLGVAGVEFDSCHLYASYNGQYSAPRLLVDDLTISYVPAPAALSGFAALAGLGLRRRR